MTRLDEIIKNIVEGKLDYRIASIKLNNDELSLKELYGNEEKDCSITEKLYARINEVTKEKCPFCEKFRKFRSSSAGYSQTCGSKSCTHRAQQNSIRQNLIEKHGVHHISQLESVKEKRTLTNLERFGSSNYFSSEKGKNHIKRRLKEKYGVENVMQVSSIQKKIRKSQTKRWLNEWNLETPDDIKVLSNEKNIVIFCDKCKKESEMLPTLFYTRVKNEKEICINCNPKYYTSGSEAQQEISIFIENLGLAVKTNYRILNGKEIDIYVEDLEIGFEFNGLYWHNELYKERNYHLEKTKLAFSGGIKLYHIWEDAWTHKKDIVKSRIKSTLGMSDIKLDARKCSIKTLNSSEKRIFFNENHIQGDCPSSFCMGLIMNGEIVSAMSFGKRNIFKNEEIELIRFCNKINCNVRGSSSRLFSAFLREHNFSEIISYSDNSWGTGEVYKKMNFNFVKTTPPNYWYVQQGIRKHRFSFRKSILVDQGYDDALTEHQIMLERGIFRIYDCGSNLWRYKVEP